MKPPVEHLSFSSMSLYFTCSRAWRFRYVDRLSTATSSNLVFGSAFHDTIEVALTQLAEGEKPSLTDLWLHNWQYQAERAGNVAYVDTTPDELQAQGQHMLTSAIEVANGFKSAKFADLGAWLETLQVATDVDQDRLCIEQKVTLTVPGMSVPVIGYVDMIGADGVPCDFKTAARSWPPDKADNELQPTFYLAALNQQGRIADTFRYYVFTKTKTPKVQVLETKRTASDMFWLLGALSETYRAICVGVFPPTGAGSWKCNPEYCEYHKYCKGG
jgi:putative RecB family exonuclease